MEAMAGSQARSPSAPSEHAHLVALARAHARERPEQMAYTFLRDRDGTEQVLSYQALDRRARAIAACLQRQGEVGDRVLLVYPPGLNFIIGFFACLYAGRVAVPVYPPTGPRQWPRFAAVARDCGATMACVDRVFHDRLQAGCATAGLAHLACLNTDDVGDPAAADWRMPAIGSQSLAFLQYTSGTTGDPKGVMVSHGNILHNEGMIQGVFDHKPADVMVGWLPLYHDMGLIGVTLQPFFCGFSSVIMSPITVLQAPWRWLQTITKYGATTSGAPNFAYDLCVRRITPEQKAGLDLRSWQAAFSGAEPVRAATLRRFADYFADCGFRYEAFLPCYGMAETTLMVTGKAKAATPRVLRCRRSTLEQGRVETGRAAAGADAIDLVGCGRAADGGAVIVDLRRKLAAADGVVGEIWVRGAHVAQGYWGRAALSARSFGARLADGSGPYLRTGDLGFIVDGELFVMGRRKELIIIRGRNFYPQDIERVARHAHPCLRHGAAAAFSVERDGAECLVLMLEVAKADLRTLVADAVIADVRLALTGELGLTVEDVVLLKPHAIPHTSSGKTQRRLCRARYLRGDVPGVVGRASAVSA